MGVFLRDNPVIIGMLGAVCDTCDAVGTSGYSDPLKAQQELTSLGWRGAVNYGPSGSRQRYFSSMCPGCVSRHREPDGSGG